MKTSATSDTNEVSRLKSKSVPSPKTTTVAELSTSLSKSNGKKCKNTTGTSTESNCNSNVVDCEPESIESEKSGNSDLKSTKLIVASFPYLTITVYIPTSCVGLIIGKRGSTIDSIQKLAAKEAISVATALSSSNLNNHNYQRRGGGGKNNKQHKTAIISPESVRISVVNYPPPVDNNQNNQHSHKHILNGSKGGHTTESSSTGASSSNLLVDIVGGAPPTYTELDFTNPQWTPVVFRSDPVAAIYAAKAVNEMCCPFLQDRKLMTCIMDLPVPAIGGGTGGNNNNNNNNTNNNKSKVLGDGGENSSLRHASIVGKRGTTLAQLSADHQCRIMVPPKQFGHNIIQLEAPLEQCCSCLEAIAAKLQHGNDSSSNISSQKQQQRNSASISNEEQQKQRASSPQLNNSKSGTNSNNNNNKTNTVSITLIIQPLPSQTKLRNIARKADSRLLKKRMSKQQQQKYRQQRQQQQLAAEKEQPPKTLEENSSDKEQPPSNQKEEYQGEEEEAETEREEEETGKVETKDNSNNGKIPEAWRLTIVANTEKKALRALDILKALTTKGYEVDDVSITVNDAVKNDTESHTPPVAMEGSNDKVAHLSSNPSNNNNKNNSRGGRNKRNNRHQHKSTRGE